MAEPHDTDAAMRARLEQELLDAGLRQARPETQAQEPTADVPMPQPGKGEPDVASRQFRDAIASIASAVLKIPPDRFDAKENMSRYGVDSIIVTEIMKRIADLLDLPIAPTVFFEARHLEELADILHRRYRPAVARRYSEDQRAGEGTVDQPAVRDLSNGTVAQSESNGVAGSDHNGDVNRWIERFRAIASGSAAAAGPALDAPPRAPIPANHEYEPVAIVAMEGLFAESADVRELEQHLRAGDDCIREVPADRWDWKQVFGDPRSGEFTNVKYGGFAPDIDKFDPLFFGMSPREAELMDPQHRLFIQCVWKLIESAGYAPKSLAGRKVGVFIGINLQDYAHLVDRSGEMEAAHLTSLGHMFCPNRLSFLLDIHGPSQVIDTACSSSLVALHRAVLSVQHEGCEMAIAGGANLLISPDMHVMYSKVGMICEDGRCKTFSRHANGYARGDGVGAVLLKPLAQAERDADTILAVIRGSAENHGGMATSLTAPNPKAQADLIVEAHRKAGIDPRSVGYVECHGTGTSLGDPIEINGLKMAFEALHRDAGIVLPDAPYCGLGSIKSNIGHAETAAGIAGVIKAVLSIRNRRLYPTLHCDDLNPMIALAGSPFFIARQGATWPRPRIDGREQPRRAGISSFGAGGSNAHVVIEEYVTKPSAAVAQSIPSLILLSARNEAGLNELTASLLRFLQETPDEELPDVADIAYTLQVGRDAMATRLALVVDMVADLKAKLERISGGQEFDDCYRGRVKRGSERSQVPEGVPSDLRQLAQLWTSGARIDWQAFYAGTAFAGRRPRRVTLPTYPFARQRYWIAGGAAKRRDRRVSASTALLHPIVHRDSSDSSGQRFSSEFSGEEFFFTDHVVVGEKVLPGVAYLEMARAAVRLAGAPAERDHIALRLKNVVWTKPFIFRGAPASLHISLQPQQNRRLAYRISSAGANGEPVLHSQGTAVLLDTSSAEPASNLDLVALRSSIADGCLDAERCYDAFAAMGFTYGPGHRCLESVYFSSAAEDRAPQVLARLALPLSEKPGASAFVLHPGLMDAALQACIGLMVGAGQDLPTLATGQMGNGTEAAPPLPFALDEFELVAQPPSAMWAWVRYGEGYSPADKVQKLHVDLCDDAGRVCVRMRGFSYRVPDIKQAVDTDATLVCEPVWISQPVTGRADGVLWPNRRVVLCDLGGCFPASLEREVANQIRGTSCLRVALSGATESWYADASLAIFRTIKEHLQRKGRSLIQVLVPTRGGAAALLGGLAGLLKTANRESSRVFTQLIELDADAPIDGIIAALQAEASGQRPESHIRYRGAQRQVLRWQEPHRGLEPVLVPWKDNGVYLITGGSGGLGLLFASQIAEHVRNATVILCGRSEPGRERAETIDRLASAGGNIQWRSLDVSRREQVDALVADIVRTSGRLDGILHCAGLLRDNVIPKKSEAEFRDVFAPKVAGTLYLDEATKALDLDFFALFASVAGAWGSVGQADYAAANAFMDAFAHRRNAQVRDGERRGHTVSIDWPLWVDGGMQMDSATRAMMRQTTGMAALPQDAGLKAFNAILASGTPQALVMHGAPVRMRQWLAASENSPAADDRGAATDAVSPDAMSPDAGSAADTSELRSRIERMLLDAVSKLMKFEPQDLEADTEWNDLGFDSISLTEFSNRLNQQYGLELTPTVFFEYPTAAALADWLAVEHGSTLAVALGIKPRPLARRNESGDTPSEGEMRANSASRPAPHVADVAWRERRRDIDEPVAIVGMSGRFPMARDLDAFWRNLVDGRDCIAEIPADRWDWKALYGDPEVEPNKTNVKWGGFIDGVGDFDARFFGISPREAERMDPQQRLLMQYAWKAIEDAGYSASSLSGGNTAMFIATAPSGYAERTVQNGSAIESYSSTGAVGSIGPNRMSYFLNIHGPSEPIETACSSSLVAIHRALVAMANGDCDQAIVGGINLVISPETHVSFSKAGMLSPDGRCKTFSKGANGYVRGEGVGMLFLKRLAAAEQAGDHIYGVIRGSAENHGGRSNSLTAPNPKAQVDLLKAAYARAGVDPRTVGYIEAHGSGTALGDPIEVNSLKTAFEDLYRSTGAGEVTGAHCGLGSIKTNIGHLELAAGIAGVIKVLLQLQHKTLVRTLHCDEVNPYIRLDGSPFYLVQDNRTWTPPHDSEGRALPRRAGVSSFGFGGVNAHIVIEEYRAREATELPESPSLVVLSAKNSDRLKASADALLSFIAANYETDNPAAESDASHAHGVLAGKARVLLADILGVGPSEIDAEHPLDDYGVDRMHRTMLHDRLEESLGVAIAMGAFLKNASLKAIVVEVLDGDLVLRERLHRDAVASGVASGAEPKEFQQPRRHRFRLADLAYTLQVGRDAMDERLAVITDSIADVETKLRAFVDGRSEAVNDLYLGQARQNKSVLAAFNADEDLQDALDKWIERGKFSKLLDLWVKGLNLDWERLYGEGRPYRFKPRRMPVPGYPFAEQRFWIDPDHSSAPERATASSILHPLVHENLSTLRQVRFSTTLTGSEFFLADHRVRGQKILPGVAYLEMARAATLLAAADPHRQPDAIVRLRDVVWIAPALVDRPRQVWIDLAPVANGAIKYEIASEIASDDSADRDRHVHSQGIASFATSADRPTLDLAALRAQTGMARFDGRQCYDLFGVAGLDYGSGHRGIVELYARTDQVLAKLTLPDAVAHTLDRFVLHPSLLDSALQASIGLVIAGQSTGTDAPPKLALPFAVDAVDVLRPCVGSMWAWVRRRAGTASDRLQKLDIDVCDERGQVCVQIRGFSSRLVDVAKVPQAASAPSPQLATPTIATGQLPAAVHPADLRQRTTAYFKELLASTLGFPVDEIRADEALDSYGIDSMMVMELTRVLEKPFGELSKTLFFEFQTLAELVDYFIEKFQPHLQALLGAAAPEAPDTVVARATHVPPATVVPTPSPKTDVPRPRPEAGALDIAVIGLSGRYPLSPDIEAFWRNLRDGKDCITEVPPDRWDWRAYYNEDGAAPGRHACKWGGFIDDVDKFDPLFFNISPSAAEYMDPQERLFLEHAWMAMEDAGYRREDLQQPLRGLSDDDDLPGQVGVYAGVMYGEYQLLGLEAVQSGTIGALTNFYASIANRVSYALNLHGPSMAVDTMCSSSLTAIHLACQDLKLGRTDLAFAGGVNVNIHPNKYGLLSLGQFISGRGKCESFGAGGDGYVPSEGVGVVVLKRLADAERDGDHIYGVIKSSALNHGGKTNGYNVPNPKAQQMAISRALREAGVDPRAIGYIEAHGTGTKLGDPIEIAGLTRAFGRHQAAGYSCWIGSSKSNIGHSEAAAGIAGLTKVLLQMREGQIAPSLHAETLNPNIDFPSTPFQVNRQLRVWPRPMIDGQTHRRCAGISSFGAGGANAHLIVEEYVSAEAATRQPALDDERHVVVLSARNEEQLRTYAGSLLQFIRQQANTTKAALLRDVAYTLQIGRETMQQRLGFTASSMRELAEKLDRFLSGDLVGLSVGRAKPGDGSASQHAADLISRRRYDELLAAWVSGASIDWQRLHVDEDPRPTRVSLPTYPFARERYWIAASEASRRPEVARAVEANEARGTAGRQGDVGTLILRPAWVEQAIHPRFDQAGYQEHRILAIGDLPDLAGAIRVSLRSAEHGIDRVFADCAVSVFEQIKDAFRSKQRGSCLFQIVIGPGEQSGFPDQLCVALAAMLKTARMENPQFVGQLIELDADALQRTPDQLTAMLRDNGRASLDPHVRYRQGRCEVQTWVEMERDTQPVQPAWREGGVYLITGGAGGLGLIFAREIVRHVNNVTLILTGRSPLDAARRADIDALRAQGASVEYRTVDVGDQAAVRDLIDSTDRDFRQSGRGPLNGIIHSAGIVRDGFLVKKTVADFQAVLAAKVSGVVNLDLATRSLDLDFFVLFSSLTGAIGNPGQSDYATANAFMDAYAAYRNRLAVTGERHAARPKGHTLSINWPLWQHGGMTIDAEGQETMWRTAGLRPLSTHGGIDAFYRSLRSQQDQVMVLQGDVARLRQLFVERDFALSKVDVAPPATASMGTNEVAQGIDKGQLAGVAEKLISKMLSDMLKLPIHRIESDVPLEQYGVDSVAMMKLTNDLEKILGPLPKTLFFEYPTVGAIGAYLADAFVQPLTALRDPTPATAAMRQEVRKGPVVTTEMPFQTEAVGAAPSVPVMDAAATSVGSRDIAVIGMSGRFPMADDLDAFWRNLAQGRDCITEVPAERWDHSRYFDPDKSAIGKTYCKWGGFLNDVDRFDARFFRISPSEAELLDPQERLFLETVWNLLESSGYLGETLERLCQSRVGVFVGSMSQQYHAFESDFLRESVVALTSPASIANRVSYFFNLQGPSIALDTMCSSALIAVHMACESLLKRECKIAIAGGVNLTIHPKKYIGLSIGQLIGSSADCASFGDGDGYLPAEGVGAVLLKPLSDAIADNDEILAVIRSTATNHAGQSNGYRVPNTSAQAELIAGNFRNAGIDPRTVSYVESAANGSRLGDAIELRALTAGFREYTTDRQFCAIGSVKSNIGHAEAASGMSQLIKVILQMRHQQLAPTIKAQPLNPNISFDETPFYLQRQLEEWRRPVLALGEGVPHTYPRRATVSSFGAGGSNAHLIVEEYEPTGTPTPVRGNDNAPQLMLFSARTAPQLIALVRHMLAFVEQRPDLCLEDLAYTLQTARETMDHRLALVANDHEQMVRDLRAWLDIDADRLARMPVFAGNSDEDNSEIRQLLSGRTGQSMLDMLLAERDLDKLALYWVKGVRIAWQPMYRGRAPCRIALPTYPFDRTRHWIGNTAGSERPTRLGSNDSDGFAIDAGASVRDNMERYLRFELGRLLGIAADDISAAGPFQDAGANSIVLIRLRQGFEQVFQIAISARDALSHATPAALAAFAAAKSARTGHATASAISSGGGIRTASEGRPLSEGQKGLWLLHQIVPGMSAYNVPVALRFGAGLDIAVFRQAYEYLLRRFPVLTSVFGQHDGAPNQSTADTDALCFTHEEIGSRTEAEVIELLRAKSKQPFDLEQGPLFRVHVLSSAAGAVSYALLTVHHIVFDGRSAALLVNALMDAYAALSAGQQPVVPVAAVGYADFVEWQRDFMASDWARAQLDYWTSQLVGELPVVSLPYDRPRPARQGFNGASHEAILTLDQARAVRSLAKSLGVSLSTVFLGAWTLLLHRYSGEADVLVGMPTLGRPDSRFDDVIGYFTNMIVIRTRISGEQQTGDFLKSLQLTLADGLDNSDYPFPALLKSLRIEGKRGGAPQFPVMFAYQNFIQGNPSTAARMSVAMDMLSGIHQEGSHDLALEVYERADGFNLRIDYDTDLFDPDTILRAMGHYLHLLNQVAAGPNLALADHVLLPPEERQRLLDWSSSAAGDEIDCDFIALFQRQAKLTPDQTALCCDGRLLSYRDLDRQSAQLAEALRDFRLTASDAVGVCIGRGLDMIVALLAIWKAGAIYVPVAADSPEPRLRHMLDDSGARVVITDAPARDRIATLYPDGGPACVVAGELRRKKKSSRAPAALPPRSGPEHAAYILYTSGSTGLPKGVVVSHRAIGRHASIMRDYYQLTSQDRVLQFASIAVDASLEQMLPGLLCGATIVIRPDTIWSAADFRREVATSGVTIADVPPSYLHELLLDARDAADWDAFRSLRLVITGGEALMPETVGLWLSGPLGDRRMINAYGPTETTVTSTVFEVSRELSDAETVGHVPIGRPLPGETAFILDGYGQPVPVGVAGELHLGGVGLAVGYLNQPALTAEKFIASPLSPGSRLYKTGDRARWLKDGSIAFLGRLDHQVKIRGFRVECGEVEAALRNLELVSQAVVLPRTVSGRTQLVAFVVSAAPADADVATDAKRALARKLPDTMIPSVVVRLGELPMMPGGKVDRVALLRHELTASKTDHGFEVRTPIENRLAEIWRHVLDIERVGVDDDFFDLGGHSLLAVRVAALVRQQLGIDMPVSALFEAPNIVALARILEAGVRTRLPLVCLQPHGSGAPWFCVHAVLGDAISYRELSRHMGAERPVYALQAPSVADGAHPGTIEGLASLYLDAIRTVQPYGPYHLGGWSMGGVIAYEMARQLQHAGERVATLALIDSYTPAALKAFERDRLWQRPDIDGESETYRANVRTMDRYVPGPYRGSVALFVAAKGAGATNDVPVEARGGGWLELTGGDLVTVVVPGDHDSILRPPNVRPLAEALAQYINDKAN